MVRSYMHENKSENRKSQREQEQFTLRQQRREEALNKKRSTIPSEKSVLPNFSVIKHNLYSDDIQEVFNGTYEFRTMLSNENDPPIQQVIDANLIPRFVELLSAQNILYTTENPDENFLYLVRATRLESAWVITNIASGTSNQTKNVVDAGALPLLLAMLCEDDEIVDQAVWALGNISGDCESLRDSVIESGAVNVLISQLNKDIKIVRNVTWLLSNLCRGRDPPPSEGHVIQCIPVLNQLVKCGDEDIMCDAIWALSYIADIYPEKISSETISDVLPKMTLKRLSAPIVRLLGNIVVSSDFGADIAINFNVLSPLNELEKDAQPKLRKEICWLLSNICAGNYNHVAAVVKNNLNLLVGCLNANELNIRTEAAWAIGNIMLYSNEFIHPLISSEAINNLVEFLPTGSNDVHCHILDGFKQLINAGKLLEKTTGFNPLIKPFEKAKVSEMFEDLQESNNKSVATRATMLMNMIDEM